MSDQANPEVIILNATLELPPAARAAYLDQACAGDAPLRQRVDELLRAHEQAENFLEAPPAGLDFKKTMLVNIPLTEKPGDKIGRYKLLQQIGEGGCGVVYMAEQEEPVRRRVALKVIKLGMDTKQVIARFEAERQALALMDHPNIAKVLDAGATETGRPYFVMELVRGIKITDFCDENKLSTEERLKLFIQVCQAIQHAHQKGIIHRDIKPSNILVTINDGVPVPKVIDFGIAKATQGRLTDQTLFTAFEQFIGTPAYMSPEQAVMTSLDIDTRSDIYSLGVLLYELLTGKTPFDARELLAAGLDEMRRTIREKEPPKPSTRLGTMAADALTTTAKHHHTDAPKLIHLLRGDLDWIAMKCLEKDRARRYETANGLAEDIRRHLADETVSAGAPTAGYRFGKFVRRNKAALSVGAALTVLALALLTSMFLLFQEFRAGKYGGIAVNSNPEGAEVWHHGQIVGSTPFKLAGLLPGDFSYSLVLNNYETVTNTTTVAAKKEMNDFTFLRRSEPGSTTNVPNLSTNLTTLTATVPGGSSILTVQGMVDVAKRGATNWIQAQTNMLLSAGDRVRTGAKSGAMLRFSDSSVVRVNEYTVMEIAPLATNKLDKAGLKFENITIQFFHGEGGSNSIRITTPNASGEIKG